jgi:hypothetical protein
MNECINALRRSSGECARVLVFLSESDQVFLRHHHAILFFLLFEFPQSAEVVVHFLLLRLSHYFADILYHLAELVVFLLHDLVQVQTFPFAPNPALLG